MRFRIRSSISFKCERSSESITGLLAGLTCSMLDEAGDTASEHGLARERASSDAEENEPELEGGSEVGPDPNIGSEVGFEVKTMVPAGFSNRSGVHTERARSPRESAVYSKLPNPMI